MELDDVRLFSFFGNNFFGIKDDFYLADICHVMEDTRTGWLTHLEKFNLANSTSFSGELKLYSTFVSTFYFIIYALLVSVAVSFAVPIALVVYVYLHWPLVIIYDFVFTCLNRLGYLKTIDRWKLLITLKCREWKYISKAWHGYETRGMENIPNDTPAIFIFYHGRISLDIYYFVKAVNLEKKKLCRAIFHRQLVKLPGWHFMEKATRGLCGTRKNCLNALRNGDHIVIAPGGDVEPLFSDETTYKLEWKNRSGFAKIAIEAQVPIIPVFTENIQELFRTPRCLRTLFVYIDSILGVPLVPAYGGFPVKLRTHIGTPIYPDGRSTSEQLAQQTHLALQRMIYENQRIPGSILAAIAQRFRLNKTK